MTAWLHRVLPKMWASRGIVAWLLLPLSWVYGGLVALRAALYRVGARRVEHLPVPVIVVGNITVGGSGKTPVVLWLCQHLREAGWRPGVVSRGYGRRLSAVAAVRAQSDAADVGDEPLMIARHTGCPVWVGRNRAQAARALLAAHPDVNVLVADDGLSHWSLGRDIELVVMDTRGAGNGWLLPAGPLREPLRRLSGVDALIGHGALSPAIANRLPPHRCFQLRLHGDVFEQLIDRTARCRAQDLVGKRLHAMAGIGHPQRFFNALKAMGLDVVCHAFPDHHAYTADDVQFDEADAVLMTEKDAVKCAALTCDSRFWVLPVQAEFTPDLMPLIRELLDGATLT